MLKVGDEVLKVKTGIIFVVEEVSEAGDRAVARSIRTGLRSIVGYADTAQTALYLRNTEDNGRCADRLLEMLDAVGPRFRVVPLQRLYYNGPFSR